ncbi:MAG: hypothetical protein Q4D05_08130 [Acinetobacter sp.]|nr:hypothetical protein [Acinetobacter sp.]
MKLLKLMTVTIVTLCSACAWNYPYSWAAYRLDGKKPWKNQSLELKVKKDMIECGFYSTDDNPDLDIDSYVKANLCMERKRYVKETLPKGVCYRYPDSLHCQK